eukprot:CAMPEP_0170177894 /NCGR_PEP_ID=MMETSP0040_2-20121228/11306_1 /TAXON_ID=641309 /ORGANISM="Lotharella oceanica, Strain CCMP622" /LENGTH=275 /DNA_ID=CAMNT_0010420753 /DNA_START=166 /DNA_END=993 /DNA_ORIENTATION=+
MAAASDSKANRPRKKYTIRNPRQQWTPEEHKRFVDAIRLYKRDWAKVRAHVGTRTVIQIRSHAQKYFLKLQKLGRADCIPPRRNRTCNRTSTRQQAAKRESIATTDEDEADADAGSSKSRSSSHDAGSSPSRSRSSSHSYSTQRSKRRRSASTQEKQELSPKRSRDSSGRGSSRRRGAVEEDTNVHDLISFVTKDETKSQRHLAHNQRHYGQRIKEELKYQTTENKQQQQQQHHLRQHRHQQQLQQQREKWQPSSPPFTHSTGAEALLLLSLRQG